MFLKNYNRFFVNWVNNHICYSYDILDGICIVIEYNKVRNEYAGGCSENGKVYITVPAKLNEVFYFSGIEIEVRDKSAPIMMAGQMMIIVTHLETLLTSLIFF